MPECLVGRRALALCNFEELEAVLRHMVPPPLAVSFLIYHKHTKAHIWSSPVLLSWRLQMCTAAVTSVDVARSGMSAKYALLAVMLLPLLLASAIRGTLLLASVVHGTLLLLLLLPGVVSPAGKSTILPHPFCLFVCYALPSPSLTGHILPGLFHRHTWLSAAGHRC